MRCPQCQTDNPDQARFCLNCGSKLATACPQCGTELPAGARFCFHCGASLAGPSPHRKREEGKRERGGEPLAGEEPLSRTLQRLIPKEYAERLLATKGRVQSERRLVTLLFSDVKSSTPLAETMDPEDWVEVMNGAFEFLMTPIYRYEGTLARLMGDAILAFFGAPLSHEDDPERAVRAALEIVAGAQEYAARLERERGIRGFNVRVGINTGLVVVGEVGSDLHVEFTAMGDAVNLAARMEQNAPPGGVLITADTYQHVRGLFEVEAQPPLVVKGKDEPIQTYLVRRARPRDFRTTTRGLEGIATRMVGREREMRRLQEALQAALAGRPHLVTIVGDAGVGKTRLLLEFEGWLTRQPISLQLLRGRAMPVSAHVPYSLWRDLFRDLLDIAENDPLETVRAKFEAGLAPYLEAGQSHLVGHLVGFDFSATPEVRNLAGAPSFAPLALAYLTNYFRGLTADRPTAVLLEDLHWADPSSLDLVAHLLEELSSRPLLLVGLARPTLFERPAIPAILSPAVPGEEGAGESARPGETIVLQPLTPADSRALVEEILRKVPDLPHDLRELIVKSAEGNPFYVEELVRMLLQDGVIVAGEERWQVEMERLRGVRVPPTLTGVLQARLDGLPQQEKGLLQRAAVVGRHFWDSVLANLDAAPGEDIRGELEAVQDRELILPRPRSAFAGAREYAFKHALLRDVAYETVLLKLRRNYHRQVAEWLEAQSGERLQEYGGLIAEHYERAGERDKARFWLEKAADKAYELCAYREALAYRERALALAPPEASAGLLLGIGDCHDKLGSYDQARDHFQRAADLGRQAGDCCLVSAALGGLAWLDEVQGKRAEARAHAEESLAMARRCDRPGVYASALMRMAEFQETPEAALRCLEESLAIFRQQRQRGREAVCLLNMGNLVFGQRDLEAAGRCYEESLAIFRDLGNRWGMANCLGNLGMVHYWREDYRTAMDRSRQYLTISREIGDREGVAISLGNMGFVSTRLGELEEAARCFAEAVSYSRSISALPLLLDAVLGMADVRARRGDLAGGAEWLGLVVAHPLVQEDDERQMYVEPVRRFLEQNMEAGELARAMERGRGLDMDAVIAEIAAGETG